MVWRKHQQLFQRRFQLWWNSIQQILNGKNVLIWILDTSYKINESSINQYFRESHFSKIDQKTDFITNEKKNFILTDNRWNSSKTKWFSIRIKSHTAGHVVLCWLAIELQKQIIWNCFTPLRERIFENSSSVWFWNWVLELGLSLAQIIAFLADQRTGQIRNLVIVTWFLKYRN